MLKVLIAVLATLLLGACVSAAPPAWLVQPANPSVPVHDPRYTPVTAGVKKFDVVDPKDWRELNREVGPQGSGGMGGMDHSNMPGMGNMPMKRDTGGK